MPVVNARGSGNPELEIFKLTVKKYSTTIKHIHNKTVDFIGCYDTAFATDEPSNLTETVPVIDMEGRVSRSRLRQNSTQSCYN